MLNRLVYLVELLKLLCLLACFACRGLRFVIYLLLGAMGWTQNNEWEFKSQTTALYWLTVLFYFDYNAIDRYIDKVK